ncbi:MAG: Mov34/MPN/PAD-1 family protein [Myxococcales bacterium]|nr:Mov34/MPN/PAD-1 family protein [Myxococcales bacterium]
MHPVDLPALSADEAARLRAHAEATWPEECCGLIVETPAGLAVRPGRNLRASSVAFELDAATLIGAARRGEHIRMVYHSHCDAPAAPSITDLRAMRIAGEPTWPGVDWLVLSVCGGRLVDQAAFAP